MERKKSIYLIGLGFIVSVILAVVLTNIYINSKQSKLLKSIYDSTNKNIFEKTQNLINDKQNTSLAIAIALSKDENLYNHLKNRTFKDLNYEKIAKLIETHSKYKNIWIQIFDKNLNSVYRSWTNIRGNLKFRPDLKKLSSLQNISTSISAGLFNVGIKARTPIFDEDGKFQGALEVVTHFDSITEDLNKNSISPVVIADKSIRKNLTNPLLSKLFIDDYYIANANVDIDLYNYIKNNGIEKYINIDSYIVENGYLISKYPLFNENGENLAYILNFIKLNSINLDSLNHIKIQSILASFIALTILFALFLTYYIKNVRYEDRKNRIILDSQPNIIIITDGEKIVNANQQLFNFFPSVQNIDEFRNKYVCICYTFEDMKNDEYLKNRFYDGKNWAEYLFTNNHKSFKVAIKNSNNELRYFSVKASTQKIDSTFLITFIDITNEILQIEKEKNEQKLIFQQSKINAVERTLNNIAHHWRQPLSVISTISSGMRLKEEFNQLEKNEILESCDKIMLNTKKLSKTIENFSTFFDKDAKNSSSIVEIINSVISFFETIFEENGIECKFTHNNDLMIECNKNDFTDSILNIIDNSIYALNSEKNLEKKVILIDFSNKELSIQDSANGIDEDILPKVFEPYFTTKHNSYGVGLGLYTVHEFFVKTLNLTIQLENKKFIYDGKNLKGLNIVINFN
ncbi:HAMP domain-containing sensor histidine kinase [Aliarcobacter skirrowii]|uniref:sensor histidine kinase n=1 Tax=Aliarcobacter skirrowii TaxID=28200 RepID=UPI0029A23760|nr:HAMP domain-containing sensor histidine kinase [Aliarcobacter skirrowii]MDX4051011.1 HAMP domain-containing sensor histidine kinase [Aliarcobacter skirrowii]